ncbi:MAG TPA: glycosyltransferase 87 family protein [Candidatus Limnocylindria bacterium]|nr:glycosyltransferase 87 family protein [Candidatus Limnocylindria bacterium]
MRGFRAHVTRSPLPVATLVVLAVCAIYAAANLVLVTQNWEFDDVHAYLAAATRLQAGGPLYVSAPDPSDLYLYAPWFAFAWMPFTSLPRLAVELGWAVVLVAATLAALWPLRRTLAGVALVLLLGGLLYRTAGWGNVQPLIVAALVYALPTRAGPWVAGVASSLKPWAILAVPVYAWRREWRAVAIVLGVAAVLWLPALAFGIGSYPAGARLPNLYDATILLAAPGFLRRDR